MKRTVLFLAIAALFCFTVKAQAQTNIHSDLDYYAMLYIGKLAHPLQQVLDAEYVRGTSDYIDINIEFKSQVRSYWEPYRINLKQYYGEYYAYSIERTRRVSVHESFIGMYFFSTFISNIAAYMGFSQSDDADAIRVLYGTSETSLTKEQKAAIALMNYLYGKK